MSIDGWLDKTKPFHKWNKSGIWFKIVGGGRVESAGDSRIGHRLTVELGAKWTIRSLCVLKTAHKRAGAATTSAIHSHILQPTHTLEVELWPRGQESWQRTQLLWCQLILCCVEIKWWDPRVTSPAPTLQSIPPEHSEQRPPMCWHLSVSPVLGRKQGIHFQDQPEVGETLAFVLFVVRSLGSLDCPGTHGVDQASLQLTEGPPVPACLQACTTMPAWEHPPSNSKNSSSPKCPFCVSKEEKAGRLHASNPI